MASSGRSAGPWPPLPRPRRRHRLGIDSGPALRTRRLRDASPSSSSVSSVSSTERLAWGYRPSRSACSTSPSTSSSVACTRLHAGGRQVREVDSGRRPGDVQLAEVGAQRVERGPGGADVGLLGVRGILQRPKPGLRSSNLTAQAVEVLAGRRPAGAAPPRSRAAVPPGEPGSDARFLAAGRRARLELGQRFLEARNLGEQGGRPLDQRCVAGAGIRHAARQHLRRLAGFLAAAAGRQRAAPLTRRDRPACARCRRPPRPRGFPERGTVPRPVRSRSRGRPPSAPGGRRSRRPSQVAPRTRRWPSPARALRR